MSKRKVPLWQNPRGYCVVDTDATAGATIGRDVFNADGTLFVPAEASAQIDDVAVTIWRYVLEIPANVKALENTTTTGLYAITGAGTSATRAIEAVAGETTVADGDGVAGNPKVGLADVTPTAGGTLQKTAFDAKGRRSQEEAAVLDDLSDVNAPTASDGDLLTFDDATSQWLARQPAGNGTGILGTWQWAPGLASPSWGQMSAGAETSPALATELIFNRHSRTGQDHAGLLKLMGAGSTIFGQSQTDEDAWGRYEVTGASTPVGSDAASIPVTLVDSGPNPLTAWTEVNFLFLIAQDASTLAHNDLDGLQGGSPTERYHLTAAEAALVPTAVQASEKGQPGGLATLDVNSKLDAGQLPALAITDTFVVNTEAAMLALSAQQGDVAVRTDEQKSYILTAEPASTLANWQELLSPTAGAVTSFNGRTGAVVPATGDYTPAQVGADPAGTAAAIVTQTITDGDTTHAPSGDAVFAVLPSFGTYTPTGSSETNVDSVTGFPCSWFRLGNTVYVDGRVDIDPTAPGNCIALVSIPVPSEFANGFPDASGTFLTSTVGGTRLLGIINASGPQNQLRFVVETTSSFPFQCYFHCAYQVN